MTEVAFYKAVTKRQVQILYWSGYRSLYTVLKTTLNFAYLFFTSEKFHVVSGAKDSFKYNEYFYNYRPSTYYKTTH